MCCKPMVKVLLKEIHGTSPFHVPHDVFGMMDLMGGERVFVDKLDNCSPCICRRSTMNTMRILRKNAWLADMCMAMNPAIIFLILYAWTSEPWKTQYWLREILNKMYKNDINGLGGK